eukprot:5077664-Amphidinium_carterae.1
MAQRSLDVALDDGTYRSGAELVRTAAALRPWLRQVRRFGMSSLLRRMQSYSFASFLQIGISRLLNISKDLYSLVGQRVEILSRQVRGSFQASTAELEAMRLEQDPQ